jgi:hypothetical protein
VDCVVNDIYFTTWDARRPSGSCAGAGSGALGHLAGGLVCAVVVSIAPIVAELWFEHSFESLQAL